MNRTTIEWTEATWNPVTGCTKISQGCVNCYAARMATRLQAMGCSRYRDGFRLTVHEDLFEKPLSWKTPRMIFVNSMSDLFHEDLDFMYIERLFRVMEKASWHTFQILTKRADLLALYASRLRWPENIWAGVTVESDEYRDRIELLRLVPAHVRFVSFEPLLSPISPTVSLEGINWVIAGGESGPGARPMEAGWVRDLKLLSRKYGASFFFKQWGGTRKKKSGRVLDGNIYSEMPTGKINIASI